MRRVTYLNYRFVESFPKNLEAETLYIALEFRTMTHICCCGCGQKVITPLSPKDWKFTFDGDSISVSPSIGNWSFPCRSHYFIQSNKVLWAEDWNNTKIQRARNIDLASKRRTYHQSKPTNSSRKQHIIQKLINWVLRTQ
ncbi:MAG: DUF6527 family protein [Candidatus Thiodiazotropha taylori]